MTINELNVEIILTEKMIDISKFNKLLDKFEELKKDFLNDVEKLDLKKIKNIIELFFDKEQYLNVKKMRISDILNFIEKVKKVLEKKVNLMMNLKTIDNERIENLIGILNELIFYLNEIKNREKLHYDENF